MSGGFYEDTERLRTLNRVLAGGEFLAERGYRTLQGIPEEVTAVSFPVRSVEPLVDETARTILDIGCGAGLDLFLLRRRCSDPRCIGIDMSFPLLRTAASCGLSTVVNADGSMLPLRSACVDAIVLNGSFNLIADKAGFFAEAVRILSPSGSMTVADIFVKRRDVALPAEGPDLNLAGALPLKDVFRLFVRAGFRYEEGVFEPAYTREFGLFAGRWRKT